MATRPLTDLEFRLLNDWQRAFPLVARPYAEIARVLGSEESRVLLALSDLKARGHISRIGAVFRPHVLGHSTLAAVACPEDRVEAVARMIDTYPEVNHNYEREHRYNLWFVVTAPSRAQVAETLAAIQRDTGLKPLDLPMQADYHIDLGFQLARGAGSGPAEPKPFSPHRHPSGNPVDALALRARLESADYCLTDALETGLDLTTRPYANLAARCGQREAECRERLKRLQDWSIIRRFGVVVRHRELGYTANAMVVWDVPDDRVNAVGRQLAGQSAVTLCYQRPRRLPDWPYNLFSMVHGRDRATVLAELERMRRTLGLETIPCLPLFSKRRFKQCGARYASLAKAA
ncbi:MAG: Lrp/AsnC family transcriptional regulator [Hydrogenophilales bacterium]|nr:Lrp/AsnC family transcriptional regulator [Hydrogenophilales bacterium]